MVIIEFLEYLLHNGLTEEDGSCGDTELFTILRNSLHLLVIQVDNLAVTPDKRGLLLLKIFGVYSL